MVEANRPQVLNLADAARFVPRRLFYGAVGTIGTPLADFLLAVVLSFVKQRTIIPRAARRLNDYSWAARSATASPPRAGG
jgi:hypothetical protein